MCLDDAYVAYQFDAAVTCFGTLIENALQETVETGSGASKRTRAKYTLGELLDERFQFHQDNGLNVFRGMEGYTEVK